MSTTRNAFGLGCLIAFGILAGLALLCLVFAGVGGYAVWQSDGVQRGVRVVREVYNLTVEAQGSPGAAELRAAGCDQSAVFTPAMMDRMEELMEEMNQGNSNTRAQATFPEEIRGMPLVSCGIRGGRVLDCGELARAYGEAVPGTVELAITVSNQSGNVCQGIYDPEGQLLSDEVRDIDIPQGQGPSGP
jgi:hypothetical protein